MLALSFFYFAIVFFLVVVGEYVAGTLHVHYGVSVVLLLFLCVGGVAVLYIILHLAGFSG